MKLESKLTEKIEVVIKVRTWKEDKQKGKLTVYK